MIMEKEDLERIKTQVLIEGLNKELDSRRERIRSTGPPSQKTSQQVFIDIKYARSILDEMEVIVQEIENIKNDAN